MELRRAGPSSATSGELRSFLARFLFFGDDVYKQVRDLSGGEKGRLALAKLIYSGVNVLVLDEPTNHLDIPSREALEAALELYEGTIVTISHDRFFLDRVATQILALDGAGNVEHYNGDYTEYHDWKAARLQAAQRSSAVLASTKVSESSKGRSKHQAETRPSGRVRSLPRGKDRSSSSATPGQSNRVKVIKKPRDTETIETEISDLEKQISELSAAMSTPEVARDIARLVAVNDEYKRAEARLAELYDEWERAESMTASAKK